MRAATAAADRPRSAGRTISPWLIGMPPAICARYSPSPIRTSSSSISPSVPSSVHALGVGGELAHRFDVGGKPGEAVGGALLAVEQAADRRGPRPSPARAPWPRRRPAAPRRPRSPRAPGRSGRCPAVGRGAACGIGELLGACISAAPQHYVCSAQMQSAAIADFLKARWQRRAEFADIINHFALSSVPIARIPARPRPAQRANAAAVAIDTLSSPAPLIARVSVRTRIVVLALIPVIGFLANGMAFMVGEREVEHAFGTAEPAPPTLADASREFKTRGRGHAHRRTRDFTVRAARHADRRLRAVARPRPPTPRHHRRHSIGGMRADRHRAAAQAQLGELTEQFRRAVADQRKPRLHRDRRHAQPHDASRGSRRAHHP